MDKVRHSDVIALRIGGTRRIDFIILGTEKAGTTFLVTHLRKIPGVHMPRREVRFFRDPFFGPERMLIVDLEPGEDARIVGIKHASYLAYPEVPRRIQAHNPEVRMIVTLRDPVDRAISAYFHYIRSGQIPLMPPDTGLARIIDDPAASPTYADIGGFGFYHRHLLRFLKYFSRDRFLILEYERLVREPEQFQKVLAFPGIGAGVGRPSYDLAVINPGSYDWPTCIFSHLRSRMTKQCDDRMNVIRRDGETGRMFSGKEVVSLLEELRSAFVEHRYYGGEWEASPRLSERLREFYQEDVEGLRRDGLLLPRHWRNFP